MKSFQINVGKTKIGPWLDAAKLVGGRCLIQGASGSGKSYLARIIAEQTIPKGLQTVILDPEGEFVTLSERYDVLIAGPDGDVPCEVRSAKLLARRIAEIGVSAVVDLSGLKLEERRSFVRIFLDTFDALPKRLERPRLMFLDEAHKYCPESGKGKSESTEAVVTLMSQGRKRGLCGVLLTQRLSKLKKDAAAEANNIFIGRTSPIDLHSAQEMLGILREDRDYLRELEPGTFYAAGPAFDDPVAGCFDAGRAKTSHPEPGSRYKMESPPPRAAIKKMIPEFAALPPSKEQEEAENLDAAKKRVRELERELRKAEKGQGASAAEVGKRIHEAIEEALRVRDEEWEENVAPLMDLIDSMDGISKSVRKCIAAIRPARKRVSRKPVARGGHRVYPSGRAAVVKPSGPAPTPVDASDEKVPGGKFRKMLIALAQHGKLSKKKLALMVGMSQKGGGFNNYLGKGKSLGTWVVASDGQYEITERGLEEVGDYEPLPTGEDLVEHWCSHSKITGKGRDMLRAIVVAGEEGIAKEELAELVGMSSTGGGFNNYLGVLRTLDLVTGGTLLVAAEDLRS